MAPESQNCTLSLPRRPYGRSQRHVRDTEGGGGNLPQARPVSHLPFYIAFPPGVPLRLCLRHTCLRHRCLGHGLKGATRYMPDGMWITKQQAAECLGVSTKQIERLVADKKLECVKWTRPEGGPAISIYPQEQV